MTQIESITELRVPGPFVVLQGLPGDGLVNTIDSLPQLVDTEGQVQEKAAVGDSNYVRSQTSSPQPPTHAAVPSNIIGMSLRTQGRFPVARNSYNMEQSVLGLVNPLRSNEDSRTLVEEALGVPADFHHRESSCETLQLDSLSPHQQAEILAWEDQCRERQLELSREWQETCDANLAAAISRRRLCADTASVTSSITSSSSHSSSQTQCANREASWTSRGYLAVLDRLPKVDQFPSVIGTLSPGSVIQAKALVTVDGSDFSVIPVEPRKQMHCSIYPPGRSGTLQFLKFTWKHNQKGYVVLSRNGYPYLGPGTPPTYTDPQHWIWRVTCPDGAFVRKGLDLNTEHISTIPYGSLLLVKMKSVNSMGLARVKVCAAVPRLHNHRIYIRSIEGWCSESLNPRSGQRGAIIQPLPFPTPARYRVSSRLTIRSQVELSSPEIGYAPSSVIVTVTGRRFSENPADRCVDRLRLAGSGGWISVCDESGDVMVVQESEDPSYHPERAGAFHVREMRKVWEMLNASNSKQPGPTITSVDEESISSWSKSRHTHQIQKEGRRRRIPSPSSQLSCRYAESGIHHFPPIPRALSMSAHNSSSSNQEKQPKKETAGQKCVICISEPQTATFVHGGTGHIACCLACARLIKATNDPCPVCRLPIDAVIQHFFA